jgi:hypothetical protein
VRNLTRGGGAAAALAGDDRSAWPADLVAGSSFGSSAVLWAVVSPWWTSPFTRLANRVGLSGALPGSAPLWLMILWIIVLGSVVPFLLVMLAVARPGPARVSQIGMIEPVAPPYRLGPARGVPQRRPGRRVACRPGGSHARRDGTARRAALGPVARRAGGEHTPCQGRIAVDGGASRRWRWCGPRTQLLSPHAGFFLAGALQYTKVGVGGVAALSIG